MQLRSTDLGNSGQGLELLRGIAKGPENPDEMIEDIQDLVELGEHQLSTAASSSNSPSQDTTSHRGEDKRHLTVAAQCRVYRSTKPVHTKILLKDFCNSASLPGCLLLQPRKIFRHRRADVGLWKARSGDIYINFKLGILLRIPVNPSQK